MAVLLNNYILNIFYKPKYSWNYREKYVVNKHKHMGSDFIDTNINHMLSVAADQLECV